MFILELTYTAPLDRVEALLADHVAWLERNYAAGVLLASGRKVPRDGGVIVAAGDDRAAIERLAADDPFSRAGIAEYRITEFIPTMTAPELAGHRRTLPS
ncbi:YciI family protein [Kitasatospora sp. NPDC059571]|uniref:YciI family protein n=1 Tax=Kitasatospora sp. NPDC059571 TaxID=3346871 RepID=UPI003678D402